MLGFFGEGADVQLHLRSWVMMVPRKQKELKKYQSLLRKWCTPSFVRTFINEAPGHQMVNRSPVGGLIPTRDEPNEGGVVCELQELDGLMTGSAAVGVQGEEQRGKNAALERTSADGLRAGEVRHVQLGELALQQSRDDVEDRAEVHKQDPGIGSCGILVLQDETEVHVDCIVYRPVGSAGELQGVQKWVCDVFEV